MEDRNRYCSKSCQFAGQRTQIERACDACAAPFLVKPSQIANGRGRFCSKACTIAAASTDPVERFWSKVAKTDACWKWTGALADGYGVFGFQHRSSLHAHKFAWWAATGHMPQYPDEVVGHTCDILVPLGDISNRACVRNDDDGTYEVRGVAYERRGHLWLGTLTANMHDAADKGRMARGDRNGMRQHPERYRRRVV